MEPSSKGSRPLLKKATLLGVALLGIALTGCQSESSEVTHVSMEGYEAIMQAEQEKIALKLSEKTREVANQYRQMPEPSVKPSGQYTSYAVLPGPLDPNGVHQITLIESRNFQDDGRVTLEQVFITVARSKATANYSFEGSTLVYSEAEGDPSVVPVFGEPILVAGPDQIFVPTSEADPGKAFDKEVDVESVLARVVEFAKGQDMQPGEILTNSPTPHGKGSAQPSP